MSGTQAVVRRLGRPGDLGWVVMAHGELYAAEFGWDSTFEALVARIVADYADGGEPERQAAWIAELGGRRVGCVFCVAADDTTAQLRILLVDLSARGHGLGGRLVDQCLEFARGAGYTRMTLWTNPPAGRRRPSLPGARVPPRRGGTPSQLRRRPRRPGLRARHHRGCRPARVTLRRDAHTTPPTGTTARHPGPPAGAVWPRVVIYVFVQDVPERADIAKRDMPRRRWRTRR
jgi:GNAT superfamily N-acetyltransferase